MIFKQYNIISRLADTEHSSVYLVRHKRLKVLRAAKLVRKCTPGYERILCEADFLKNLKHSGIPLIYDIQEDDDSICIIEEFISGKSLAEYVKEKERLELSQILDFTEQLCNILEYLHNEAGGGILHLDLKPDNIFVDGDNNIKIIDFDSSLRMGSRGNQYGTVGFAAPEQYCRVRPDCRADIYSLGMLILYMDNGHIQSNAGTLHHKQLYPIVKRCIHHNAVSRYRSVTAVYKAVNDVKRKKFFNNKAANHSQIIGVYGTKSGVGTTHICLCITAFLSRKGFNAVCVERADSKDIISEAMKGILKKDGTFSYKGISICPKYDDNVLTDFAEYDYKILDCGTNPELAALADLKIAVTEFGYRKRQEFKAIQAVDEESLIFVNHTSGDTFYEELKEAEKNRKYYRIPCVYDWWSKNVMLSAVLREALEDIISSELLTHTKGGRAVEGIVTSKRKAGLWLKKHCSKDNRRNGRMQRCRNNAYITYAGKLSCKWLESKNGSR